MSEAGFLSRLPTGQVTCGAFEGAGTTRPSPADAPALCTSPSVDGRPAGARSENGVIPCAMAGTGPEGSRGPAQAGLQQGPVRSHPAARSQAAATAVAQTGLQAPCGFQREIARRCTIAFTVGSSDITLPSWLKAHAQHTHRGRQTMCLCVCAVCFVCVCFKTNGKASMRLAECPAAMHLLPAACLGSALRAPPSRAHAAACILP